MVGGENSSMCPSMSFKDRMIAFGVCTGVGIMLSIGGTINMFFLHYTGQLFLDFLSVSRKILNFIFHFQIAQNLRNKMIKKIKILFSAFGILYSLGTITSLIGTGFLRGPMKQLKALTDTSRLVAVLVMFLMIALTICASVWWEMGILALIFCGLQFLSYMWYCLSYIPYGRDAVTKCFKSCVWSQKKNKSYFFFIIQFLLFILFSFIQNRFLDSQ